MSVAVKVAWWDRWMPGGLSPSRSSGPSFATAGTPVGPKVEIFVDSAWTDISPDVRYADKIQISGGRPDESSRAQQNTCRFTLNNQAGVYSPRNPASPLYGKIGRNTPVRVSVDQAGTTRYRFYGEIVAWPQQWDLTGNDVWVPVEAAGLLRRLNQGDSPLRSALYRGLVRESVNPMVAYWPMEDGAGSTSLAAATPNTKAMTIGGAPTLAAYDGWVSSEAIVDMASGNATAAVPAYTVTGKTQIRFLMTAPTSGGPGSAKVLCSITTTGTAKTWKLVYDPASSGTLALIAYDSDGVQINTSGSVTFGVNGLDTRVSVELTQSGADVSGVIRVFFKVAGIATSFTTTYSACTVQRVTSVILSPNQGSGSNYFGHLTLQTNTTSGYDQNDQIRAHEDENPLSRLIRLCYEEGISFGYRSTGESNQVTMGPQGLKTLVDLLQECADSDLGVLYEPRDRLGLEYMTRRSLYNQDPLVALSYTDSDLFEVPTPVDDDQLSRNDVTVKRDGGSSARAVLQSGPLSTLPPPLGIGTYDDAPTVSLGDDLQLPDQAGWRVHLGTVDEPRYPSITVHLKRSTFAADYGLTASALLARPGDRLTVSDVPAWLPAGDVSQLVQGWTEWFDQFEHVISFNGSPESPWRIATLDSASFGRADTDGSALVTAVDNSAVALTIATTSGPVWVDSAAYPSEFPFTVIMGGETMSVTAITGTTSPQTFTVTRSVNGVVKSQVAGESVSLLQPMTIAL